MLLQIDLKQLRGYFQINGEAMKVIAMPWGEIKQINVADQEIRSETIRT